MEGMQWGLMRAGLGNGGIRALHIATFLQHDPA